MGMLTVFQHPCSYPGPKGSEIICSSQFSTSEEKILPDRPLIVSHLAGEWIPSLQDPTHNSLICISSEKPAMLSKNRRVRSLLCETNYTSTADSSRSTFLILLYIRAHVSVHFPTLNLSGLGGNLKPCSINFYSGSDSSRSKNSHRVSATSCSTALSLFPLALSFSSPFS